MRTSPGSGTLNDHEWEIAGKMYRPERVIFHPSFRVERDVEVWSAGADVAIVKLATPVENVEPAVLYHDADEVGRVAALVGFGRRGDGINGPESPIATQLLAGENVIDSAGVKLGVVTIGDGCLMFDFDHPNDPSVNFSGDERPLSFEAGMTSGDSGGGMFINRDDKWYLVGLMAIGPPRSGILDEPHSERPYFNRYGQIGGGMRLFKSIGWINDTVNEQ